jgi:hypothetical protein
MRTPDPSIEPMSNPHLQPRRTASVAVSVLYVLAGLLPTAYAIVITTSVWREAGEAGISRTAMWPYAAVGLVAIVGGIALFMEKAWARWAFLLVGLVVTGLLAWPLSELAPVLVALAHSDPSTAPGSSRALGAVLWGLSPFVVIFLVAWSATAFVLRHFSLHRAVRMGKAQL